ncbi:MAG: hypothetical protein JWR21_3276 [Herminiimonas sp.]|nr:hypothetical protein [Herminiimonas sp.]
MILFLDFDGVLHPSDRRHGCLSCRAHFERVIRDYASVDIVISSDWRRDYSIKQLRSYFSYDVAERIIGVTPDFVIQGFDLDYRFVREREIESWRGDAGREREGWIALDDTDLLFSTLCWNLVLVDRLTGFDDRAEAQLRAKLESQR